MAESPPPCGTPEETPWYGYATDWAEIKERWGLTMTPVESEIVMDMLGTCEVPPTVKMESRVQMVVVPGEHKPTPRPEKQVYSSCEETAAAGEERAQGSQGGGRGFPAAMVQSAKDGDGDRVVVKYNADTGAA